MKLTFFDYTLNDLLFSFRQEIYKFNFILLQFQLPHFLARDFSRNFLLEIFLWLHGKKEIITNYYLFVLLQYRTLKSVLFLHVSPRGLHVTNVT